MSDPYDVVRQFEAALCEYTGAPFCVTTTSCTSALMLVCAWCIRPDDDSDFKGYTFEIPCYTYVGVAQSIRNVRGSVAFRDEKWDGLYQIIPYPIWDSARYLTANMYWPGQMICVSFHHTKHLGLSAHGGAILHDNPEADAWLRRARFDGRIEGVAPKDDSFQVPAWHCYMTPPTAAEGLLRLASLPEYNDPLPWGPGTSSDYPDLSKLEIFK